MIISFIVCLLIFLACGCWDVLYSSIIGIDLLDHYLFMSYSCSHMFFFLLSSLSIIHLMLLRFGIMLRSTWMVIMNALWSEYGVDLDIISFIWIHSWSLHYHRMISLFAFRLPWDHEESLS